MGYLEERFGLAGRVALVIGASSGLGAQLARALAGAGADLGLVARRADRLEELAGELTRAGRRACCAPADATRPEDLEAAVSRVEAELGPIDVLVNSAGVAELRRAELHPLEAWTRALEVNLTTAFLACQAVGRRWIRAGRGGRIVNVSSVMGSRGNPVHRTVSYVASKGGLDALTRQLAVEWAPHGIAVNALAPSYFPTEMTVAADTGRIPDDMRERMEQFTPMARVGRDGELDTALLFLTAPASTFVTGVVLPVDGGWTAW